MYADPAYIKQHPRTIKLNDHQARKFELLAELLGKQPATLIRELAEEAADARLSSIRGQSRAAAG
jgi:hypothetical protein